MTDIHLPSILEAKLAQDRLLRSIVDSLCRQFSQWFEDSKTPFFPDFTDHGIRHVEEVLDTACALISEESESLFTPSDAAILCLGVLYHDCAMHLSEAGFKELIFGRSSGNRVGAFDTKTWQSTWEEFYFSARRWDDSKIIEIFGADEDGIPRGNVRDPFDHWNNLGESDRRLIGEFIRNSHGRLAHEFAVYGVPGNNCIAIPPCADLSKELRDLSGFVARSHSIPIRSCSDYLTKTYHKREYQGVHAVYLMALLRVADFIQVQASRAPVVAFKYKYIPSKISQLEFKAHNAVRNITATHDDPESLEIQAQPGEVAVFLRLKKWLKGIQEELDRSWAVLGEVYGSQSTLKYLGIKFRRIRSNLDDVATFSLTVSYLPAKIRFDVARAELLKLLIKPLYGNDPSYGVRELMQNAIDAVREREIYQEHHPEASDLTLRRQHFDVLIELSEPEQDGKAWISISDRGIGMTEEIIRDYFLCAGASFRRSERWRAEFETLNGAMLKSVVMRSGRFGVGALAAFLIGDFIEVETRHINAEIGFRFSTRLDSESIEVIRDDKLCIGTSIKIRVNQDSYAKLWNQQENTIRPKCWDWFCDEKPTVGRFISAVKKANLYNAEMAGGSLLWRKMNSNFPYEVYWTFDQYPNLTCNGIFVSNRRQVDRVPRDILGPTSPSNLRLPSVAVRDPDGKFPLNLQRNGLTEAAYPFAKELITDVFHEMIAWIFFHGINKRIPFDTCSLFLGQWLNSSNSGMFLCKDGYGLILSTLLEGVKLEVSVFVKGKVTISACDKETLIFLGEGGRGYYRTWPAVSFQNSAGSRVEVKHIRKLRCNHGLAKTKKKTHKRKLQKGWTVETQDRALFMVASNDCPDSTINYTCDPEFLPWIRSDYETTIFSEGFFEEDAYIDLDRWLLDDLWDDLFNGEILPYSLDERRRRFPKAAEILSRYNTYPNLNLRQPSVKSDGGEDSEDRGESS